MTAISDFDLEWQRYCDFKGGGAITMNIKDMAQHFAKFGYEQAVKDIKERLNIRFEEYKGYYNQTGKEYFDGKMDALDMLEQDIDTLI